MIVGVGGIGCELLKVVCKLPLASVHIIDMDTIEVSPSPSIVVQLEQAIPVQTRAQGEIKSIDGKGDHQQNQPHAEHPCPSSQHSRITH